MTTTDDQTAPGIIKIEQLTTHYGERQILDELNLEVNRGEVLVIMGGSGSGKSTLLRTMLGLNKATSGSVDIMGIDVVNANRKQLYQLRRNIGVAFQGGALFGSMSLIENVQLPLREHTNLDENTIRIMSRLKLDMMNLSGFDDLMPSELSGGMIKRAALARAVVMDPKLLFFDEPSAGLDPVVAAELDEYILELKQAMDMTIVVVTHELESAFRIADRITILDKGKMVITGTVDEVKQSQDQHVQNLLNRRAARDPISPDEYLDLLTRTKASRPIPGRIHD
ncbi:ABC transporter ATP-binding protein [Pleionea sp. CnH1-48]|uniref:ABC transporter ATP-binding protein n=1 Tax=Pleionea sp. CnH1-48 TaxID=2954494 RepID=UPI00209743B3|nr:ABC transporter ATP-binding protein [Pleionea sp. CnH1-48]MCO7226689.1 ABC transporter ATP-binding protein [Pleionea sp. CnH1-48]